MHGGFLNNFFIAFCICGTMHLWEKGIQVCSDEGPHPFQRGNNNKIAKVYWQIKISSSKEQLGQF